MTLKQSNQKHALLYKNLATEVRAIYRKYLDMNTGLLDMQAAHDSLMDLIATTQEKVRAQQDTLIKEYANDI